MNKPIKYFLSFIAFSFAISGLPLFAQEQMPSVIGNWEGSYVCAQGSTGLTLIIDTQTASTASGYFHFYPPLNNPEVSEGCYKVTGEINLSSSMKMDAMQWIFQPPGYVMVGLEGKLQSSSKAMSGNVVAPSILGSSCTTFSVFKKTDKPALPNICRGSNLVTFLDVQNR